MNNYIALHAFCKESMNNIIEWMEYHIAIGIDHIITTNTILIYTKNCLQTYNQFPLWWIGFMKTIID